eukprot:5274147-Amphidinium_carterae.1
MELDEQNQRCDTHGHGFDKGKGILPASLTRGKLSDHVNDMRNLKDLPRNSLALIEMATRPVEAHTQQCIASHGKAQVLFESVGIEMFTYRGS